MMSTFSTKKACSKMGGTQKGHNNSKKTCFQSWKRSKSI